MIGPTSTFYDAASSQQPETQEYQQWLETYEQQQQQMSYQQQQQHLNGQAYPTGPQTRQQPPQTMQNQYQFVQASGQYTPPMSQYNASISGGSGTATQSTVNANLNDLDTTVPYQHYGNNYYTDLGISSSQSQPYPQQQQQAPSHHQAQSQYSPRTAYSPQSQSPYSNGDPSPYTGAPLLLPDHNALSVSSSNAHSRSSLSPTSAEYSVSGGASRASSDQLPVTSLNKTGGGKRTATASTTTTPARTPAKSRKRQRRKSDDAPQRPSFGNADTVESDSDSEDDGYNPGMGGGISVGIPGLSGRGGMVNRL